MYIFDLSRHKNRTLKPPPLPVSATQEKKKKKKKKKRESSRDGEKEMQDFSLLSTTAKGGKRGNATTTKRETTEWEDAQRKFGNWKPLEEEEEEEREKDDLREIQASVPAKTNGSDDDEDESDEDEDDEAFMKSYREKRISELKQESEFFNNNNNNKKDDGATLKTVRLITREEWTREVTKLSRTNPVLVLLTRENNADCYPLERVVEDLAYKYRASETKFRRAEARDIIPNYPERNVPTIILYRNGDVVENIVGIEQFGGRNGVNPETVKRRVRMTAKASEFLMDEREAEEKESERQRKIREERAYGTGNNDEGDDDDDE
jgi:hypothetical protein